MYQKNNYYIHYTGTSRMLFLIVCVGMIALVRIGGQEVNDLDYYVAAVYEHRIRGNYGNDTTRQYIEKNLEAYETAAAAAADKNADILAFPEFGLFPGGPRETIYNDVQYVPDPKSETWNPCLDPDRYHNSYVLVNLSCMAKRYNLVIVANLLSKVPCNSSDPNCPEDGVYMYNTNAAFNRSGTLIGRYRKTHLYYEDSLNILPEPEYPTFETDFGTFGTFICFDIEWKESVELVERKQLDAVVFTTLWFEYFRPGITAVNIQQSWANTNNITMIASNRQQPWSGTMGSGIYLGATRISNYIYEADGQSRLLVSKVPRRGVTPSENYPPPTIVEFGDNLSDNGNNMSSGVCSKRILGKPSNLQDLRCGDYDLTDFTLKRIEEPNGNVQACNNGLCCSAQYESQNIEEAYYLAVFNGTHTDAGIHTDPGRYNWWLEACIFVRCDPYNGTECSTFPTQSNTVFTKLTIEGNFTTKYVYPAVTISSLQLLPTNKWSSTDKSLSLATSDDHLLFATLYGRAYERDP